MQVPFCRPDIGEQEIVAVAETLRSKWITTGPKTAEFERALAAFCGAAGAVCLNSQSAAEELTLRLLEIGPGDEVLVPAYTYAATANAVCHVGARPVLVDCAPGSFQMDYDAAERAVTEHTKAIIPVDLGGVPCDYRRIYALAQEKRPLFRPRGNLQDAFGRIAVVADAAHSFGGSLGGVPCGSLADFTCFSFHATKNLTTGEGGAALWRPIRGVNTEKLYKTYRMLALHGQTRDAWEKNRSGGWSYEIKAPGYKYNMTDMAAALGLAQLRRYDEMQKRRRERIAFYEAALRGLPVTTLCHSGERFISSGHLFMVLLEQGTSEACRNALIQRMEEAGAVCGVHYQPLPLLKAYRDLGWRPEAFPNAMALYRREITLPLFSGMSEEEAVFVAETFRQLLREQT